MRRTTPATLITRCDAGRKRDKGGCQVPPFQLWTPKKINSREHQHGIIGTNSAGDPWRFSVASASGPTKSSLQSVPAGQNPRFQAKFGVLTGFDALDRASADGLLCTPLLFVLHIQVIATEEPQTPVGLWALAKKWYLQVPL